MIKWKLFKNCLNCSPTKIDFQECRDLTRWVDKSRRVWHGDCIPLEDYLFGKLFPTFCIIKFFAWVAVLRKFLPIGVPLESKNPLCAKKVLRANKKSRLVRRAETNLDEMFAKLFTIKINDVEVSTWWTLEANPHKRRLSKIFDS